MTAGPIVLLTDARTDAHASPGHPERPGRREAAVLGVRDAAGATLLEPGVAEASDAEVAAVHDAGYLTFLADAEGRGAGWLDPDTYLVPGSMAAARLAAGGTLAAARMAARGEAEIAFAAVRPPGHHAAAGRASGFCLLNSVAIGVAGLRADGVARRIAVIDWDVHHGDGTQAIFDADPDLLYASTHQVSLYPGSGWPEESGIGEAAGTKRNHPLDPGDGDAAFVGAWTGALLPAVETFGPEAIIVSAGYDAHRDDPLAELEVTEAGYEAVARALGEMAARLAIPGVALSLEGGYDLDALRASVAATIRGLRAGRSGTPEAT